jgi:hypothetical protein
MASAAHCRQRRKAARDSERRDEEQARRLGHAREGKRSFKGVGCEVPLARTPRKPAAAAPWPCPPWTRAGQS